MVANLDTARPYDFSGYATKYNVKCTDGRTIMPGAFSHADGQKVPLVWRHLHDSVENILGHAILEHRDDGVYAYGYFNNTRAGQDAKIQVQAGDISALSIFAYRLDERNKLVHSGILREMSLVLSGANPGARIDNLNFAHEDGSEYEVEDQVVIYSGEPILIHDEELEGETMPDETPETVEEENEEELQHADGEDRTVADVMNTLNEEQRTAVYAVLAMALEGSADLAQSDEEGDPMKKNVFEDGSNEPYLSHEDLEKFATAVFHDAPRLGSFREAFLAHAGTYGIDNISYLFPDAKVVNDQPDWITREMGWVTAWMSGTRHTPFSRIKSIHADLTPDEARAKGYITGDLKVEQVFALLKRTTDPTTVYKKQKLDRDDIIDVTDFNVVSWLWQEMRFMLNEELARAALVGDGRTFGVDDDAIDPSKIRPIYGDDVLYSHLVTLEVTVTDYMDILEAIILARKNYKGKGRPNLYTTADFVTNMLLLKDTTDRYIYDNVGALAAKLRVNEIVEVEVLEGVQRTDPAPFTADLMAIMVNPRDYTYGSDAGGEIATFDDFDIDYNQYKYLIETRLSGALVSPKTAICIERKTA